MKEKELTRLIKQVLEEDKKMSIQAELSADVIAVLEDIDYLNEDCHYDHHGYCQAHNLAEGEDCHVFKARKLLAQFKEVVE